MFYTFKKEDFLENYNGPAPESLSIKVGDYDGRDDYFIFKDIYLDTDITITVPVNEIDELQYFTESDMSFNYNFEVSLTDINGNVTSYKDFILVYTSDDNQAPTLGDNTISVDNRAITTLTLPMFTSQLTPPYNDPEGDLIDAIRLDEISTANKGKFMLQGFELFEGSIIYREEIENGDFTHEGPDQDTLWSDNFHFSARDEGSQKWVQ